MVGVRLNRLFNSSFIEHSLHMKEYSSSQSCVNDSEMHKRYDNSDKNNNNNDNNDNSGKNSNNNSNNDNNKNDNHDNSGKNNNSNNKDNINDGTINVKHESVYKLFEKKLLTMKELNKSILIKQFEKVKIKRFIICFLFLFYSFFNQFISSFIHLFICQLDTINFMFLYLFFSFLGLHY